MNKIALLIPRPGISYRMVQNGYADALRHLGWKVYCGDPKTKLCCRKWIETHGIELIMTHSRYGLRQLPIQTINDNRVTVVVSALPLNPSDSTIDGPYEFAHRDEPDLIAKIRDVVVHTHLEPDVWSKYMSGWQNKGVYITHLPFAGNLVKALPLSCNALTDVAMIANFSHRQGIMRCLIEPLFKRLDLLGHSYQAFGDNIWQLAGLNYNGPLVGDISKLSHIYATAKVCPNVHTEKQISIQACLNERSFMIPLCGGVQVVDNPLASKYLESHCAVATSTTDFMNKVIGLVENQHQRFVTIKESVAHVAYKHTYFNRLIKLFLELELTGLAYETESKGKKAAIRHCWELDARLSAEERNVPYGENQVGVA